MLWALLLLVFCFWWNHNARMDEAERRRQAEAEARYFDENPKFTRYD